MIKKFVVWCRWCHYRIAWDETSRQWHRVRPNKFYDDVMKQVNHCPVSRNENWHDPDPRQA